MHDVRALAERLRATIETNEVDSVSVTVSLGVSALRFGAENPEELLEQADKCLYAAKRGGRNRVVEWNELGGDPGTEAPDKPRQEAISCGSR